MTRAWLLLAAFAGCLSAPTLGQPTCSHDSDCPIAGESCQMGVCWGAPPTATFAAAIAPPAERTDLFATELEQVSIGQDGWIDGLVLEAPVTMSGTVFAYCSTCSSSPIAASVELTRPSRIPGQPALKITATSDASAANGLVSWHVVVPPTDANDLPYTITVVPDPTGRALDSAPPAPTAAQLYPPARFTSAATSEPQRFAVGSQQPIVQSGTLTDSAGLALHGYRVVALGRWDLTEAAREVSTVDYSTDGHYAITLSQGLVGPIEIVAQSYDPTVVAPTLHLTIPAPDNTQHVLSQPAGVGAGTQVQINVVGMATSGSVGPVVGASVVLHIELPPRLGTIDGTTATFAAQDTTDASGTATLTVPSGDALPFKLQIVPPASSNLGVIYDQPFSIATDPGKAQTLPSRVAIHGTVADASGHPVGNVTVTAAPALRFLWSLDAATLRFVANIPPATAVTPSGGDFVVWVDPYIGTAMTTNYNWGYYDLAFQPPSSASAPRWTLAEIQIPRVQSLTDFSVDTATLPEAAYVHGAITDPAAAPLVGAQLSIYELATDTTLCTELQRPVDLCIIPATLGGRGTSDANGTAALTLPR